MTFVLRSADLGKLNSLTKYPSIQTYHRLDTANGGLQEEPAIFRGTVLATEKVDGTNARIILAPDGDYLLGSREELLYARGDLIGNPALGIVEALKPVAERVRAALPPADEVLVLYGEVFGGKVTAASKQYTAERRVGFRLFDALRLGDYAGMLARPAAEIAAWRENGGQPFCAEAELLELAAACELELAPRLLMIDAEDVPLSVADTAAWLKERLPETLCRLDAAGGGQPEGIVMRTLDRAQIAKLRFEDYERTLRRRK
ncbi:MAG TPA: RNA ligase family protein [Herpetosiphonaceae bacterium]|nr:RNA ligase family protein [Herpetosiphonaceae bacterium]